MVCTRLTARTSKGKGDDISWLPNSSAVRAHAPLSCSTHIAHARQLLNCCGTGLDGSNWQVDHLAWMLRVGGGWTTNSANRFALVTATCHQYTWVSWFPKQRDRVGSMPVSRHSRQELGIAVRLEIWATGATTYFLPHNYVPGVWHRPLEIPEISHFRSN